jgi:hypothetical protein
MSVTPFGCRVGHLTTSGRTDGTEDGTVRVRRRLRAHAVTLRRRIDKEQDDDGERSDYDEGSWSRDLIRTSLICSPSTERYTTRTDEEEGAGGRGSL